MENRLSGLFVAVCVIATAPLTAAQEPICSGTLYGTVGFSDLQSPPAFRTLPGAVLVLRLGSTQIRVAADEDGDFESQELECGRYTLQLVMAPDGTRLELAPGQARSVRIRDGGDFFDVVVELGSSPSASWARNGQPSRLHVNCPQADSPLALTLRELAPRKRRPLRKREIELVASNVGSVSLRLNRRGFWPARIFDRYGMELGYVPDYPFGPPATPTEDDVLTLVPGQEYIERFELGESTDEEIETFQKGPYYLQAHYYGSPFESGSDVTFDRVGACSRILVVR